MRRPSSVCPSVNILRKSLLLPDKWLDRHQTSTRWSLARPESRVFSRSSDTGTYMISQKSLLLPGKRLNPDKTQSFSNLAFPSSVRFLQHSKPQMAVSLRCEFCHRSHGETLSNCLLYNTVSRSVSRCTHFMKHYYTLLPD